MKFILIWGHLCLLTQETENSSERKHMEEGRSEHSVCVFSVHLRLLLAAC